MFWECLQSDFYRFLQALEKIKSDPGCAVTGCHYEIAREDYHQAVVEFVRDHFKPDEPLARSISHLYPWNEDAEELWMLVVNNFDFILYYIVCRSVR